MFNAKCHQKADTEALSSIGQQLDLVMSNFEFILIFLFDTQSFFIVVRSPDESLTKSEHLKKSPDLKLSPSLQVHSLLNLMGSCKVEESFPHG